MTTKDYQTRSPLRIFLSYFKPHRRLFALDLSCAFLIACIDLAFPLVSRAAMYTRTPAAQRPQVATSQERRPVARPEGCVPSLATAPGT